MHLKNDSMNKINFSYSSLFISICKCSKNGRNTAGRQSAFGYSPAGWYDRVQLGQ